MLPENTDQQVTADTLCGLQSSLDPEPSPPEAPQGKSFPIHPLLIAAFPILSLYARNVDEVPLKDLWMPLGLALLGSLAAWGVVTGLTKRFRRAALIASAVVLIFFSYGHIANLLPEEFRGAATPICLVGLAGLLFAIFRTRGDLINTTSIVNVAAFALLVPSCLTIGTRLLTRAFQSNRSLAASRLVSRNGKIAPTGTNQPDASASTPQDPTPGASNRPDIYYIILDAYGRADSLKNFYGYDNTPFIRALEKRGFYVPSHSRANYAQTGLCLPTSLNMDYFPDLLKSRGSADHLFESQRSLIDENSVAAYLRTLGYQYVYIWTGVEVTHVKTADLELDDDKAGPPSSFAGQVLSLSALDAMAQTKQVPLGRYGDYDQHRAYITTAFTNLDNVASLPYTKFVFAHISAPHPPFVFGPEGEHIYPRYPYSEADGSEVLYRITKEEYKRGYIAQVQYLNQRVIEVIDSIMHQSSRPPIIIVQGDHGSRMNVNWTSQAKTDLREPFSILNAYLVPPRVRRNLYDRITPVNSFRIVLSSLFGANYPRVPDRSFFVTADRPLEFHEVTGSIPEFSATPVLNKHTRGASSSKN